MVFWLNSTVHVYDRGVSVIIKHQKQTFFLKFNILKCNYIHTIHDHYYSQIEFDKTVTRHFHQRIFFVFHENINNYYYDAHY